MASPHLDKAKSAKNDEFYTLYPDVEKEVNAYLELNPDAFKDKIIFLPCDDPEWSNFTKYFAQNFEKFKLKKVISTSYAVESKKYKDGYQTTLFEKRNPKFDKNKTRIKGKIFTLTKDKTKDGRINIDDLDWQYLEGDGDFRSEEVKKLRDEADVIITNPPFSLFREFLKWIIEAKKQFLIIGNVNNVTYKEVFKLIKENKVWLGIKSSSKAMYFKTSDKAYASRVSSERPEGSWWKMIDGEVCIGINNSCWFTNLDHGRRHQKLPLMTMKDNLKFHSQMKNKKSYEKYDDYDAIEVPFTNAIPSDYEGAMGVPVSFLDKYNPNQFKIIGIDRYVEDNPNYGRRFTINNKEKYARILIKHKKLIKGKN
jgi:hypothetical protein